MALFQASSLEAPSPMLRRILLEFPLLLLFSSVVGMAALQRVYSVYVVPIVQSYRRGATVNDLYDLYRNEFTYYNRRCSANDITTGSSADLLVSPNMTPEEAANVMLQHGAVALRNVLQNETASLLRAYLTEKNHRLDELGYNEVFWIGEGETRVSLGLGAGDAPIVQEALRQVGSHSLLKHTLEAIIGPNPAIVEISTLTAKKGCYAQGIHSDSDYFGSSLLYARTFLHSYSMFIALQDTPKSLGATTVCPGSHYCADPDLEQVCLDNGAFEVSTNGKTGDEGMLSQGDAFLFNQNIWHRGSANMGDQDRVMFILTFTSRRRSPGDRRRQGLGTYYYQRWNMWGHTFEDLKDAGSIMLQPIALLRALGIWKVPGRQFGISWIHQFAQQLSNGDDFYEDSELLEFRRKVLDWYQIPSFLQSNARHWKTFIPETMQLWFVFLAKLYAGLAILTVLFQVILPERTNGTPTRRIFFIRMLQVHAIIAIVAAGLLVVVDRTELGQTVRTGDIFVRPFPSKEAIEAIPDATTFPERHDVLIGTRYDAEFLGSFNRFLDQHPGNQRWIAQVARAARLPLDLQGHAVDEIVKNIDTSGARFLLQDFATGAWTLVSKERARMETRRAVRMQANPLVQRLATHLKYQLADYRFGTDRDTIRASRFGPAFVDKWLAIVFGEDVVRPPLGLAPPRNGMQSPQSFIRLQLDLRGALEHSSRRNRSVVARTRSSVVRSDAQPSASAIAIRDHDLDTVVVGERVWVYYENDGAWYQATLMEQLEDDNGEELWKVEYSLGGWDRVYIDSIRKYIRFQQGDRVEVDYSRNSDEYFSGYVTLVHPSGGCDVLFDDGEYVSNIPREYILLLNEEGLD